MSHILPPLPYEPSALEPYISANTLNFHHGKHHQAYVTNLNKLTENTEFADLSLEEIIMATAGNADKTGIFNNAAQVWNHTFFWQCLKPHGGGQPKGDLKTMIDKTFGSYENFAADFKQAAVSQFGSGWAWLAMDKGALSIMKTANADLPLAQGGYRFANL